MEKLSTKFSWEHHNLYEDVFMPIVPGIEIVDTIDAEPLEQEQDNENDDDLENNNVLNQI